MDFRAGYSSCKRYKSMLMTTASPSLVRNGIFNSIRFQGALLLIFGLFAPVAVLVVTADFLGFGPDLTRIFASDPIVHSLVAVTCAIIVLIVTLRQMETYPGVMIDRHIVPAMVLIYATILLIFLGLRLEYSRLILGCGFIGTLLARYAIAVLAGRTISQTYFLVPPGRARTLEWMSELPVQALKEPSLPLPKHTALIADLHFDHTPDWERFLAEAAISGTPVYHYKQVWEAVSGKVQIEHISENNFGALIPGLAYRKAKRIIDFCTSLLLLPLLSPILIGVALLIRLDSPGPALFLQRRMGYRGKFFNVIKFRTMTVAENGEDAAQSITASNDQRVTRLGRFLRRSRIDELPQILNIIAGDMSWIGPRPEAIGLSRHYETKLPFYRYRHIVRPGITGWAQVNQGHVTDLDQIDEKLQYDFYYIKNFSYWIDLLILFRTIKVMLTGFGAR